MRELWNLYGEAVEATQSFVDVDDVAAIPDALDGRRIRVGLRLDGGVVAMQPVVGLIFDLETLLSLFGDRDIFRRHLLSWRGSRLHGRGRLFRCCRRRRLGKNCRDQIYEGKGCRQRQHRDQQLDPHVGFLSPLTPAYKAAKNLNSDGSGVRKNGGGFRARQGRVDKGARHRGLEIIHFRDGSKTEVCPLARHVRSTLDSRHREAAPPCPFRANTGSSPTLRSARRSSAWSWR